MHTEKRKEINHNKIQNPVSNHQIQELQSSFPLAYGTYNCQPMGLKKFVDKVYSFVDWKNKKYHLKVVKYDLVIGLTEDLSLGDSLSDSVKGLFQRDEGRARIHRSFCKKPPKNPQTKKSR